MLAPAYIQRELQLIDPLYFIVYNPCITDGINMSFGKGRWQIRMWSGVYPKRLDLWNTDASEDILTICEEEFTQERGLHDTGYLEISMADIHAIRKSHWWKLRWKEKIAALDERNDKKETASDEELNYQSKYVAKRIWRHLHEPTVNLSGKEWEK